MIDLKHALIEMKQKDFRDNNGNFSVLFLTCNRDKKMGGNWIKIPNACRCGLPPHCKEHEMIGVKDMDTGKKYAIHNRLIFEFNNQPIYWV